MSDTTQGDLFAPGDPVADASDLTALHELVRGCTRCDELVEYRTQPVPGAGSARARVFFIGEAPGRREDELGAGGAADRRPGQLRDALQGFPDGLGRLLRPVRAGAGAAPQG